MTNDVSTNDIDEESARGIGGDASLSERSVEIWRPLDRDDAYLWLAAIAASSDDAIIGKDLDGLVTSWNRSAELMFGYTADEIIGRSIFLIIPPDRIDEETSIIRRIRSGEKIQHFETKRLCKDGTIVSVSISVSPIRDDHGRLVGISKIARDCSERDERERLHVINDELRAAEQALRASEARFRILLNTLPQKIFLKDRESNFIFGNENFAKDFRIAPDEIAGRIYETFPKELADKYRADDQDVMESGRSLDLEEHYVVDGVETAVQTVKVPMRDENGEVTGLLGIYWDITERKQNEVRLRESEQLFHTLADSIPQIVWIGNPDGLVTYFNQQWVDYTGLTLHESYGRGWDTPFHPDDKQPVWDAWNHATQTGETYRIESRLRDADGRYGWFLMKGTPLRDATGQIVKWFGTCTDITEFKRTQETLRKANVYNRSLIEASLDPLVTIAPDGKISDVNDATEKAIGLPREILIGTDFCYYFTDREKANGGYRQVFDAGQTRDYELELRCKDGTTMPVLYNASVYHNETGEIAGIFAAARDVTARKRAERQLRDYQETLEETVKPRTSQLTETNEQLEAANKELEGFSYSVSHDLRTPLRAIDGFSRMLMNEHASELGQETLRLLNVIRVNTRKMSCLIDDILAFARVGRAELKRVEVDMEEMARMTYKELESTIAGRSIEFKVGVLPKALVDVSMIKQVFVNLLDNAIKYSAPKTKALIKVEGHIENDEAVYVISDNGVGFDMKYVGKLFGVFQRLHGPAEFSGTGIGLSVVKRIITRHGGRVWADGKLDQGASFTFTLSRSEVA
jgi:PAS domain S-box-containing protein